MKFDMKKASQLVLSRAKSTLHNRSHACLHTHAWQVALLAEAGLPKRTMTIAYVLGVIAGSELDIHGKSPESPVFMEGTTEHKDYATGIKDAVLIGQAWRDFHRPIEPGHVFDLIFGPRDGEVQ